MRKPGIKIIEESIDALSHDLRSISFKMQEYKEIAFEEFKTHDLLADFMEQQGWKVRRHAYGMKTAVEAVFENKEGGAVVGYNAEMDALPGLGHACGHNLIAIVGIAAAIANAKALEKTNTPGKIILLGTPAEETIGGKIELLEKGAYKEMDVCLMAHPAPFGGLGPMLAVTECQVEYHGHTAHAAAAPWEATNALDAAVLAYTNISALRQQVHPSQRVHGIITGGERWVTNVIPDYAGLTYGIRAPLRHDMLKLQERVYKCFEAAAEATGCRYDIKQLMQYFDLRNNSELGNEYRDYMEHEAGVEVPITDQALGSTDFGNVSYQIPSLHPIFGIPTKPGSGNHTTGFTAAAATPEAHEMALKVAKGLAATGWKASSDKKFLMAVKKEFESSKSRDVQGITL